MLVSLSVFAFVMSVCEQESQMWVSSMTLVWYHVVTITIIGTMRLTVRVRLAQPNPSTSRLSARCVGTCYHPATSHDRDSR